MTSPVFSCPFFGRNEMRNFDMGLFLLSFSSFASEIFTMNPVFIHPFISRNKRRLWDGIIVIVVFYFLSGLDIKKSLLDSPKNLFFLFLESSEDSYFYSFSSWQERNQELGMGPVFLVVFFYFLSRLDIKRSLLDGIKNNKVKSLLAWLKGHWKEELCDETIFTVVFYFFLH